VMHEKMIELNKAFEVLSDAEKRQMYDTYGEDGPKQQVVHHHANFEYVFG
jgi:DnaJ-class molecular chaperone